LRTDLFPAKRTYLNESCVSLTSFGPLPGGVLLSPSAWQIVEQIAGAALGLAIILDVFLTVLYARAGTGIFSYFIAKIISNLFRLVARNFDKRRGAILSYCGPLVLISIVGFWSIFLAIAAAMILHPYLGTSVTSSSMPDDKDFITALFAGGNSLSIVGTGDFTPQTTPFKLFYFYNSLIGTAVISLTLTYLMQVYSALNRRNSLAMQIHQLTGETADAAQMIARLGPSGKFDSGNSDLSSVASSMTQAKESHHFYPVLFYFRFRESLYSVSQFALVALDACTLIRSALDETEYGWLKRSAPVDQLYRSAKLLTKMLTENFVKGNKPSKPEPPDQKTIDLWRRRFADAVRTINAAGIKTQSGEEAIRQYIEIRTDWQHFISTLGPTATLARQEIDPKASPDTKHSS
jgi:hypothetical protein